eukprot:GHVU01213265.1.p1 GENE.GHVU01213265.1~~GHVU01213265.1.p1  ORF type:complete len:114 (+),score=3.69 GHVU01213265.1:93-434(+)
MDGLILSEEAGEIDPPRLSTSTTSVYRSRYLNSLYMCARADARTLTPTIHPHTRIYILSMLFISTFASECLKVTAYDGQRFNEEGVELNSTQVEVRCRLLGVFRVADCECGLM